MVTINFRLREIGRIELALDHPETWQALADRCAARSNIELGGILAVRRGTLLQAGDLVVDGDVIEVFPALAGG